MQQSKEIIGNGLSYGDTSQSFTLNHSSLLGLHVVVAKRQESIKHFLHTENLIKQSYLILQNSLHSLLY